MSSAILKANSKKLLWGKIIGAVLVSAAGILALSFFGFAVWTLVPEKLEDLVPRYLPKIPVCPLTSKPLGYQNGRVWSAGRNGVDDGGVPGKDNDVDAQDGDVVWVIRRE